MDNKLVRLDGVKWQVEHRNSHVEPRRPIALCPDHHMRLTVSAYEKSINGGTGKYLHCDEGHIFTLPRDLDDERRYVLKKIDSLVFSKLNTVDLDGELTPIAKTKVKNEDGKYFLTAQLMESKRGLQVVIYAGKKGRNKKTQIFIEPEVRRLSFDQKDLNPTEVFVELKATFDNGSAHEIKR